MVLGSPSHYSPFRDYLVKSGFFDQLKHARLIEAFDFDSDTNTMRHYLLPFFNALPESLMSLVIDDTMFVKLLANSSNVDEHEELCATLRKFKLKKLFINCGTIV